MSGTMLCISPFNRALGNRGGTGDFHRPYEGLAPSIRAVGKSGVSGDFHRPYEGLAPFNRAVGNRKIAGAIHQPFTAPTVRPEMKYFWKKG